MIKHVPFVNDARVDGKKLKSGRDKVQEGATDATS